MSTQLEDQTATLATASLTSDYVVATAHGKSGIYKVAPGEGPTDRTGTLVHLTNGSPDEFVAALELTGAKVERVADALRLLDSTGFAKTVDFTAPMNTETVLVSEIARLNKAADDEDRNDALGGGWGNAGAGTRKKAEAFTEALDIYRRYR